MKAPFVVEELASLDGISLKDAANMPHPTKLSEWSDAGLYEIDTDLGVFRLTNAGREACRG